MCVLRQPTTSVSNGCCTQKLATAVNEPLAYQRKVNYNRIQNNRRALLLYDNPRAIEYVLRQYSEDRIQNNTYYVVKRNGRTQKKTKEGC